MHLGSAEVNLMESRNFVAAREMAAGGSWLIPTMNGALRLAKPPLPTWTVAAVIKLTGQPDTAALLRLPAAGMSVLLVLFFWGLARELTQALPGEEDAPGRTAWLATLVLASSLLVITVGREGHWDIFTHSFLLGALWALARGWRAATGGWRWFLLSGLLLGGSILSKGPVALYAMLLPFLLAFGMLRLYPDRGALTIARRNGLFLLVLLALLVGLAWPAYLAIQDTVAPAALAVARLEATSWVERHARPFWDYLNFPVFAGIWAPVALLALAVPYARPRAGRFVPYLAVLAWVLAAWLLLSIIPEKKERYMLPLMPPLALLVAGLLRYFETAIRQHQATRLDTLLLRIWTGLLALIFALLPVALFLVRLPGFGPGTLPFTLTALIFGALAVWMIWLLVRKPRPVMLMGISITAMSALLAVLLPVHAAWVNRKGDPDLRRAEALQHNPELAQLPWYTFEELHIKEVWRAGRATPSWPRTPDSVLVRMPGPVAVLASINVREQLPAAWREQVRLRVIDSFYIDRTREAGYWRVTVVEPLP
ncbi:ArnT family glycosyltransferase [Hymenobacter sediminicola]|uniref:Glycosyltransferase family 39 protein n=1 Tax=Hymenobacter sediminicola TaxID=2761579 RepID=A0A7G7W4R1_9BACT|nr:glycosyltransferase family 39 protein [Hymenobacter sediminicola]QNH61354.1 glycosyltransferase family 39 protein [Hymenobacter sediminicola]